MTGDGAGAGSDGDPQVAGGFTPALGGEVAVEPDEGSITVAGQWRYAWAARRRPHLHPVSTPGGRVLTREAPDDHPWHHGLWFTVKFVNGENFWEEYDDYGVLRHNGPPEVEQQPGGRVALRGELDWIRPDRRTVVIRERRALTHVPLGPGAYGIDLDTTLVPLTDVRLDRTPFTTWGGYGGLTVRGAADFTDTRLLLDDGSEHDRVLGVPSRWIDVSRTDAGIALLDHPANRRHPVPVYGSTRADTYGEGWSNFVNAAFLWDDGMDLAEGEALRVRHRVVVHDGGWHQPQIQQAWDDWVAER